jgi:tubulin-like protein CetZ
VNTDQADLTGLRFIKDDLQHRVLLGLRQTLGHGVGKINELGAQLAKEDGDKVLDAVKASPQFYETHAFLIIAGAAGGTGSGRCPSYARRSRRDTSASRFMPWQCCLLSMSRPRSPEAYITPLPA